MRIINAILAMLIAMFSCSESCYLGAVEVEAHDEYQTSNIKNQKLTKVTAYCPCPKCCGKWSIHKTTASGHKVKKGDKLAAAPPEIPFGTMLSISGYNEGRPVPVLDRGGAIKGNHIDVFFDKHEEAMRWGIQWLEVKYIEN
jgi:3D (Asp-Asp-Asp) domain-containing protein